MSEERVDKKWVDVGLDKYSTAAILGTLKHYGVALDEASFKKAAEQKYPMSLAAEWSDKWKGSGQFKSLLPIAIGALWRRWLPDQLTPETLGVPLFGVMRGLAEGNSEVAQKAFEALDQELPKLPTGERRAAFMRELEPWLDAAHLSIEGMLDDLAGKGKLDEAKRLASVSDRLFPDRADVVKAVLEARTGDKAQAKASLTAIARDVARPDMVRLAAVDALVPLEGAAEVFDVVEQVQEKAVREGSTAVLYALHATSHLLGPVLQGPARERARVLVDQQHEQLQRLTGRAAH